MNKRLIFLILVIPIIYSCVTIPSPAQDSVIISPYSGWPIIVPMGYFDDKENYLTKDEYDKLTGETEEDGEEMDI